VYSRTAHSERMTGLSPTLSRSIRLGPAHARERQPPLRIVRHRDELVVGNRDGRTAWYESDPSVMVMAWSAATSRNVWTV
jgi:hypothetical protein